jgi:uncharacterized protein
VSTPGAPEAALPAVDPALGGGGPRPRWGFGDVAVALLAALFLGVLTALAVSPVLPVSGRTSSSAAAAWASLLVLVVPWLALAGWPVLAARRRGNGPVRDFGLRPTWRGVLIGFGCGLGGLLTGSVVYDIEVALRGGKQFTSSVGDLATQVTSASQAALLLLALCTAFGAPVVEELAFRGLTYGSFLKSGQPVVWSVTWTSVLFALYHFEPVRLPVLLAIGVFLGIARASTKSTAASMVAHMTVNLSGALAILHAGH